MIQQPSVGRIVHYQPQDHLEERDGQPFAAIVTAVCSDDGQAVRLKILTPDGREDFIPEYGPIYVYAEVPTPGHWSWPPRV